jgi:hypothetical protein
MAGSLTPTSWWRVRDGLVSGPRKLKTVGTPSSLADRADEAHGRVEALGEAEAHAGLGHAAATPSGPSSMATPSASSTSAVPTDDEAARLPCLQTGTPPRRRDEGGQRGHVDAATAGRRRSRPGRARLGASISSGQGTAASTMARASR